MTLGVAVRAERIRLPPVAGIGARPGHFSEPEYDQSPVDNLRTYPVYYPGREPESYWVMIQKAGPPPLNTRRTWTFCR